MISFARTHAAFLLGLWLGIPLGITIAYPFGLTLPDGIANLWGALAGAFITIFGAILIWKIQETQRAERVAKTILNCYTPLLFALEVLIKDSVLSRLSDPSKDAITRATHQKTSAVLQELTNTRAEAAKFSENHIDLDSERLNAIWMLRLTLESIDSEVREFKRVIEGAYPKRDKGELLRDNCLSKLRLDLATWLGKLRQGDSSRIR